MSSAVGSTVGVSRKGRAKLPDGFVPIAPGEVRNPKGNNQYTYKRNFERAIDSLLCGDITPEHLAFIPESVRPLIEAQGDMSRGEVMALITVIGGLSGDEKQLESVLKRLWPVMEKRELSTPDGPLELSAGSTRIDMSVYTDEERETLLGLVHRQLQAKGGGKDE